MAINRRLDFQRVGSFQEMAKNPVCACCGQARERKGDYHLRRWFNFEARLGNLWVDSGPAELLVKVTAEFAAGGFEGSLLYF